MLFSQKQSRRHVICRLAAHIFKRTCIVTCKFYNLYNFLNVSSKICAQKVALIDKN